MLMISARKDFWSSTELSDTDEVREVNLNDDSLGTPVAKDTFLKKLDDKKVLLLIHGYNNEEDDVVRAYNIIEKNVNNLLHLDSGSPIYDMIIGYTWPGGDDPLNYYSAKRRASAVSPRVNRWIDDMRSNGATIDIMGHSMGCRVSLLALQEKTQFSKMIRNLFLTAAAVDNESIEKDEEYYKSACGCDKLYVFHSKNDNVLNISYRTAERDAALGYSGPENPAYIIENSPNVKVINCKNVVLKHGGYKDCAGMYSYIKSEFGVNPAKQYNTL